MDPHQDKLRGLLLAAQDLINGIDRIERQIPKLRQELWTLYAAIDDALDEDESMSR